MTIDIFDADKANYDSEVIVERCYIEIEDGKLHNTLQEAKVRSDYEYDKLKDLEEAQKADDYWESQLKNE